MKKPIRLIELFAGIGSQSKALKNLGYDFEHYRVCEFDKFAIKSYNAIHGTDFQISDITELSGSDLGIVDRDKFNYMLTYSFPCQDLSNIGLRKGLEKGFNTRSGLLWEVERLLKETSELPQFLIMENVPAILNKNNIGNFKKWENFLIDLGYSNFYQIVAADNFNIPQSRKRCFMISILGNYQYDFPKAIPLLNNMQNYLEPNTALIDKVYLSKIRKTTLLHAFLTKSRSCAFFTRKSNVINTLTTAVGNRGNYDPYFFYGYDTIDELRNDLIHKIITHNPNLINVPVEEYNKSDVEPIVDSIKARVFTPLEAWRFMGFDDNDFYLAKNCGVSNTQLYKQAGNSIVVPVLEHLFSNINYNEVVI